MVPTYAVEINDMKFSCLFLLLLLTVSSLVSAQENDSSLLPRKICWTHKKLAYPTALLVSGVLTNNNNPESIKNEIVEARTEHFSGFNTKIDNYLQFSPILIAYGLDAAGVRSKTDFANRTAILVKGEAFMFGTVSLLKQTTRQLRPDKSAYTSFPSGHTAQAFAAATFLSEEYKDRWPWMPYASYGIASSVGLLRMANNRHYISDVLMGAGLGLLSMKAAYWTHRYNWANKKHKHINSSL